MLFETTSPPHVLCQALHCWTEHRLNAGDNPMRIASDLLNCTAVMTHDNGLVRFTLFAITGEGPSAHAALHNWLESARPTINPNSEDAT